MKPKTYNPMPSKSPCDAVHNLEALDEFTNSQEPTYEDRFDQERQTLSAMKAGMEDRFQQFLLNSGYENIGDYAAGLEITARNQIFWRDGELYRAGASLELPYTTTGDWGAEEGLFVAVGDQALRQELQSGAGANLVGYTPSDTGAVKTTVQDLMGHFVLAEYFGVKADGVTDDTEALQNALNAASNGVLLLPKGEIKITTVTLPTHIIIKGQTSALSTFGTRISSIGGRGYLFQTRLDAWSRNEFKNICFEGVNCLDLRTGSAGVIGYTDVSNCTFHGGDGTGIAINILNHDFSRIENNNFFGWSGYCAITCFGWIDTENYAGNKKTTQVSIRKNVFSGNQYIGTSCDVVDSINISENDYGSTDFCHDVGGYIYRRDLPNTPDSYYQRGEPNPTQITWGEPTRDFFGLGWHTNVHIFNNHHEHATSFGWIDGRSYEHNQGFSFHKNNVFFSQNGTTEACLTLRGVRNSTVNDNVIDIQNNPNAVVFDHGANSLNLTFADNTILSSFGAVTNNGYVETGGSFGLTIYGKGAGVSSDNSVLRFNNATIETTNISNLRSARSAGSAFSGFPARPMSLFEPFSANMVRNKDQFISLRSMPGSSFSGLLVLHVDVANIGANSSIFAFGSAGTVTNLTKISTETNTDSLYSPVVNNATGEISIKANVAGSNNYAVTGFIMGMGV